MIRLYRARFSTNVERVALALAHKQLETESIWISYHDRSPVITVSGQGLVPVIDDQGIVVTDSTRLLLYLEEQYPQPALFPAEPARRAELELFVDWFNRVWKCWPNNIERELASDPPDHEVIDASSVELQTSLDRFGAMLSGRDYLMGEFSAADCAVFPFLKYARGRDPDDDELFHRILEERQTLGDAHTRLAAWIDRVDARARV